MSNTFCPLPWIHLATRPNGDVRLCCGSNASGAETDEKDIGLVKDNNKILNLSTNTIDEVWNSDYMRNVRTTMLDGKIPPSCQKCFTEESNGIVSKRQWETQVWNERLNIDEYVKRTQPNGSLPVDIPYFDLRLGNTCQLQCVMCSPHDSSSWVREYKLQFPKYKNIELIKDQSWDDNFDYSWYKRNDFLDSMKSQAQHIKELYFAGGEPLLIPEHYRILEFMVETGNAVNCILRYNSNGLELPDKLFELWKHFKQVKFNFSIDAIEERNEYIRYPTKWDNVVDNLIKLDNTPDNIIVNIACAVQALNVYYIDELIHWKETMNYKKINVAPYGAGLIGTHLVYLPNYLNVRVLPKHIKQKVYNKIEYLIAKHSHNTEFVNNPYGMQRYNGLIKYMQTDWSDKLPAMIDYLNVTDERRGTNYKDIFPILRDL